MSGNEVLGFLEMGKIRLGLSLAVNEPIRLYARRGGRLLYIAVQESFATHGEKLACRP